MAKTGLRGRPVKSLAHAGSDFRIDIDLDEAERAAERVKTWLVALRQRHDLTRYEYTRFVRVVPAGLTQSHPILTLGTRFAETEDHLLATYLHEQMHWYLSRLGGPDYDPVTPFFDELVRRYPQAPTRLPEGARSYEQTYVHIVVCWLELKAVSEFIGWDRAAALAETNFGYRWIYRTVIRDFDALGALFERYGVVPIKPAATFIGPDGRSLTTPGIGLEKTPALNVAGGGVGEIVSPRKSPRPKKPGKQQLKGRGARKKTSSKVPAPPSRRARRKSRARGGRSRG